MPFVESWEEFEKAAERLYLQDPMKVRYSTKYNHSEGCLVVKMTDDVVCLQYKTDAAQDVKKMDKFVNNLMRPWPARSNTEHHSPTSVMSPNSCLHFTISRSKFHEK